MGLFSLIVVPTAFHALLPDRRSREFRIVKELSEKYQPSQVCPDA